MLREKPLTAIIPVRGGSKRLPGKNMRLLDGKPLLQRAIELAQHVERVDRCLVTTDDPQMYRLAEALGAAAPSLRPPELATDSASSVDVVEHLLTDAGVNDGYLLLLQVTSPLRTAADLEGILDLLEAAPQADAAVSLCRHVGSHPEKMQIVRDEFVASYLGVNSHRPEQSMADVYALNGAFYLVDVGVFRDKRSFIPPATLPFVMPDERSINLDTNTDWQILDAMLSKGYWSLETLE